MTDGIIQEAQLLLQEWLSIGQYDCFYNLTKDLEILRKEITKDHNTEIDICNVLIKLKTIVKSIKLKLTDEMILWISQAVVDTLIDCERAEYVFDIYHHGYAVLINLTGTFEVPIEILDQLKTLRPPLVYDHVFMLCNILAQGVSFQQKIIKELNFAHYLRALLEEGQLWVCKIRNNYCKRTINNYKSTHSCSCEIQNKHVSCAVSVYSFAMYLISIWSNNFIEDADAEVRNLFYKLLKQNIVYLRNCTCVYSK